MWFRETHWSDMSKLWWRSRFWHKIQLNHELECLQNAYWDNMLRKVTEIDEEEILCTQYTVMRIYSWRHGFWVRKLTTTDGSKSWRISILHRKRDERACNHSHYSLQSYKYSLTTEVIKATVKVIIIVIAVAFFVRMEDRFNAD